MTHLIRLILLSITLLATSPQLLSETVFEDVTLLNVIDGDTIHIQVKVWPSTIIETKLRVFGIDTPEKRTKCDAEKALALEAKKFTTNLTSLGFSVGGAKNGKYAGRALGRVYIPLRALKTFGIDEKIIEQHIATGLPVSLSSLLVRYNLAVPYFGAKKKDWAKELCPNQ